MRRYTTPTLLLQVRGADLSSGCVIYVTLKQEDRVLTKTSDDPGVSVAYDREEDATVIALELSQAETAAFSSSGSRDCAVQVNWVTERGIRMATRVKTIRVDQNLLDREVAYAE